MREETSTGGLSGRSDNQFWALVKAGPKRRLNDTICGTFSSAARQVSRLAWAQLRPGGFSTTSRTPICMSWLAITSVCFSALQQRRRRDAHSQPSQRNLHIRTETQSLSIALSPVALQVAHGDQAQFGTQLFLHRLSAGHGYFLNGPRADHCNFIIFSTTKSLPQFSASSSVAPDNEPRSAAPIACTR